jgi:MSHA biogenesis protein MshI
MLYVAAVPSALLNQMADLIDECELELDSIDVAELVLFGSVMQSREPQKNTAVLYLDNRQGIMCLGQQHAMYLSRSVDSGLDTLLPALKAGSDSIGLSAQQPQDAFLLEAQRSLDYYESQQGKGAVVELVCMPMAGAGVSMQNFLKDNLAPEVIPLEFNALFETEGPFQPAEEQHCLLAAMAAKRWQHHTRSAFQLGG